MRSALVILLGLSVFAATLPTHAAGQTPSSAQASLVGFSISVTPGTMNIQNGSSANAAIMVTSEGLNGPVRLGALVSPSSGLQAVTDPPSVTVLPGGNAISTLEINATSAQIGDYKINVTGSSIVAPSKSFIVTVHVTSPPSQPSGSHSSNPPQSESGPSNQQPATTTSGSNPKAPSTTKARGSQSIFDPVWVIVAGNLLAALGSIGAIASMHKKRSSPSRSNMP